MPTTIPGTSHWHNTITIASQGEAANGAAFEDPFTQVKDSLNFLFDRQTAIARSYRKDFSADVISGTTNLLADPDVPDLVIANASRVFFIATIGNFGMTDDNGFSIVFIDAPYFVSRGIQVGPGSSFAEHVTFFGTGNLPPGTYKPQVNFIHSSGSLEFSNNGFVLLAYIVLPGEQT